MPEQIELKREAIIDPSPVPLRDEESDYGVASDTLAAIMVRQGKLLEAKKIYIQMARNEPERYEELSQKIRELGEAMRRG